MECCCEKIGSKKTNLFKIVSVATDGAYSMTGKENGFINLFTKHVEYSILSFYCLTHQQVLCTKTTFKSMLETTNVRTKLIDQLSARALNIQKFQQLLISVDSIPVVC